MGLRGAVAEGETNIDGLRELAVARDLAEMEDAVADFHLRSMLREEYGIPDELTDSDAESVLSAALSNIISGDITASRERLRTEFSTMCERDTPEEQATSAGHPSACHLHDLDEKKAESWNWVSVD